LVYQKNSGAWWEAQRARTDGQIPRALRLLASCALAPGLRLQTQERSQPADSAEDLGFQRRMGFRAAVTSSRRPTRVECGAVFTNSGCVAASSAIDFIASMKRSHSSLDSDSVG